MKNLATLLLLLVIGQGGIAQSFGEIQGKVLDEKGQPMPFVGVTVFSGTNKLTGITDDNGKYRIKPLPAGTYNVEFSFIGYDKQPINGVMVDPDKIRVLPDVTMQVMSFITGPVIVEWTEPMIDAEETSRITMRAAEFSKTPVAKEPMKLIASMSSDISMNENTGELYFRGARSDASLYLLDGVRMQRGVNRIPGGAIGSVSVYTGGVPAKYGDLTGGVVVIETRNYFDFYNEKMAEMNR